MRGIPKMTPKDSTELIVYQLGELKNLMENVTIEFKNYREKTDDRISSLERFQAAQVNQPKIDIQKIVLAAFTLISTVVAAALAIAQSNLGK